MRREVGIVFLMIDSRAHLKWEGSSGEVRNMLTYAYIRETCIRFFKRREGWDPMGPCKYYV